MDIHLYGGRHFPRDFGRLPKVPKGNLRKFRYVSVRRQIGRPYGGNRMLRKTVEIDSAAMTDGRITATEFRIYVTLCALENSQVSVESLQALTGVSMPTLIKGLNALASLGAVSWTRGSPHKPRTYTTHSRSTWRADATREARRRNREQLALVRQLRDKERQDNKNMRDAFGGVSLKVAKEMKRDLEEWQARRDAAKEAGTDLSREPFEKFVAARAHRKLHLPPEDAE